MINMKQDARVDASEGDDSIIFPKIVKVTHAGTWFFRKGQDKAAFFFSACACSCRVKLSKIDMSC